MKSVLVLVISFCALVFSCQSPEVIRPLAELEPEVQTCHLSAKAVVQYREAHNGMDPFYYLSILDGNGKPALDVYTNSITEGVVEVGEVISIVYHYEISNGTTYVSTCGDEAGNQPTREQMAQVKVCQFNT